MNRNRNEILQNIKKVRSYSVRLGSLEEILENTDISEGIKDEVEKSCWKLIKELNKLTSEIKEHDINFR